MTETKTLFDFDADKIAEREKQKTEDQEIMDFFRPVSCKHAQR